MPVCYPGTEFGVSDQARQPVSLKWNAASTLDTNVLVSGLLSPAGNEALILLAIHQGLVRPCSEEILRGAIPVRMKTL